VEPARVVQGPDLDFRRFCLAFRSFHAGGSPLSVPVSAWMEAQYSSVESDRLLGRRLTAARTRREHKLVRYLVGSDCVALALACGGALFLSETTATLAESSIWAAATLLLALLAFTFYDLYERDRRHIAVSSLDETKEFLNALALISFLEVSIGHALHLSGVRAVGPTTVLLFFVLALALLPLLRGSLRHLVVPLLDNPQNTVILGAGQVGQTLARKIRKHPEYNLRVVGFLDDEPTPLADDLDELRVLGGEGDLVKTIRRYRVSRVVLAFSKQRHDRVLELIRNAGLKDVHISIVPRYFEIMAANAGIVDLEGIPVVEVPSARLSRVARMTKRSFDLILTIPGLVFLSPVFLIIALAIKLDSPGPVFFRQARAGRRDRAFEMVKFRTMVDGAEKQRADLLTANEASGPLFKIREDPRVTRVGRWLRKLTLDELPQLINVLKGEMSLVGPRPFPVYEDQQIDGWARRRLDLTPGITGVWQVLGRNDIGFAEMVKLDYLYVNNWSLWWDIKLLLRTVPIVLRRSGY
jgi:exopolysaccharide biosynthesis polyprenyl glycosylphosphotransferase